MKENEYLIGEIVEGFSFDGEKYDCGYDSYGMDKYIGKKGIITRINNKETCYVEFSKKTDDSIVYETAWSYPIDMIKEQIKKNNRPSDEIFKELKKIIKKVK